MVRAASGPYAEEPRPSRPIAGTPSKAPILRSLNSRFASRRPSTSLRTLTCIILVGLPLFRAETARVRECSRAVSGGLLSEKRDVLARDHPRLALTVPAR